MYPVPKAEWKPGQEVAVRLDDQRGRLAKELRIAIKAGKPLFLRFRKTRTR